jgi:excisionase family DNA binding protein
MSTDGAIHSTATRSIVSKLIQTLTNSVKSNYTYPTEHGFMSEKEYLTEKEACSYLGISRATLHNYVKRGLIRRYEQKAPRQVLYKTSELAALQRIEPKE